MGRLRGIVVGATAAGCLVQAAMAAPSGKDNDCTATNSYAWCLMSFVGQAKGLPDSDAPLPGSGGTARVMNGVGVGIGVGQIAGKISAPPGISPSLFGAMTILTALSGPDGKSPQAFVFVPVQEGSASTDDEGARSRLINVVGGAAVAALRAEAYEIVSEEKNPPLGAKYVLQHIRIKGGECETNQCEVHTRWFASNLRGRTIDLPQWTGGGKAFTFLSTDAKWNAPLLKVNGKDGSVDDFLGLVENLPDYFYFYFPPGKLEAGPVVLQGSRRLRFVAPSRSAATELGVEKVSPASAAASEAAAH